MIGLYTEMSKSLGSVVFEFRELEAWWADSVNGGRFGDWGAGFLGFGSLGRRGLGFGGLNGDSEKRSRRFQVSVLGAMSR